MHPAPAPSPAVHQAPAAPPVQQQDALDLAIREAATYFNINITEGSKIAILSVKSDYPQLSEYVIDVFTGNVVNDRRFKVVERSALEAIRKEMEFQMSGEVDDNSAQAIGRKIGAQTILLGSMSGYGSTWRLSIRALVVESAEVVGLFNKNIPNAGIIAELSSGPKQPAAAAQAYGGVVGQGQGAAQTQTETVLSGVVTPQGNTLAQQLAWIASQAGDGTTYDVVVNNDVTIGPTTVSTMGRNITVIIRSASSADVKTIQLVGQGLLFTVDASVTLKLQDIVLKGHSNNNCALVLVGERGKLILNSGSKITSNTNTEGGGGGIVVGGGFVELNDGSEISGNTNSHKSYGAGGGIVVSNGGEAIIRGGIISRNTVGCCGGGVYVHETGGTVTMHGGVISKNSIIPGGFLNDWCHIGGGVAVDRGSTFIKRPAPGSNTSGIIYGNVGNDANSTNAQGGRGHAIVSDRPGYSKQRNTTLGYYDEISTDSNEGWGQ
jgi:hypothetical protein